jgi:hypothetical protein
VLGQRKGNLMLRLILFVLCLVPLEPSLRHADSYYQDMALKAI